MSEPPSVIGRYQIRDVVGRGGMGQVYRAWDPALSRDVVVKVMQADGPAFRRRFLREARAAGCLNHDAIVTIFDAGESDGQLFIVMEYVEGRTVGQIIKRGEVWPLPQRLRLMRDLCDGLAYAHARGIVHRDVKPDNLMVRDPGGSLAILDFGIARTDDTTAGSGGDEAKTESGDMIGTPHYMAPEQIRGETVDHRCDIFCVGLVFYELLAYRRAFDADSVPGAIYKILHEEPPLLTEREPGLDPAVIRIVERAMAKAPEARYQALDEARADLDAVISSVDSDATLLQPSALFARARRRAAADGSSAGAASEAYGARPGGGGDDRRMPGRVRRALRWSRIQEGLATRAAVVRSVGVLLGGAAAATGGLWLASSPEGSDPHSGAVAEAAESAGPGDPADPGVALAGGEEEEAGGDPGANAGRDGAAAQVPARSVEELLAEANRAFGEGDYAAARRLFREARALSENESAAQESP